MDSLMKRIANFKIVILALLVGVLPLLVRYGIANVGGDNQSPYFFLHTARVNSFSTVCKAYTIVLLGLVLAVLMTIEFVKGRDRYRLGLPIWIPIGIYTAMLFASTAFSDFGRNVLMGYTNHSQGFLPLLSYVIFFVAAASLAADSSSGTILVSHMEKFLMFGAAVASVIGVLQVWGSDPYEWDFLFKVLAPASFREDYSTIGILFNKRAYVSFGNPNYVGSYCALVLTFFMMKFLDKNAEESMKPHYGALVFLLTALLMGSESRAGMIGVGVVLLVAFLLDGRKWSLRFKEWGKLLGIMGLALLFLEATTDGFISRWIASMAGRFEWFKNAFPLLISGDVLQNTDVMRMGSGRLMIWKLTSPILMETFILGKGPEAFVFYYPHAKAFELGSTAYAANPHNLYLQMFVNIGGVALLAFITLVSGIYAKAFAGGMEKRSSLGVAPYAAAVAAYLITGIFNDPMVSSAPIFWIFLGLLAGIVER